MATSSAKTVAEYLESLTAERRAAIGKLVAGTSVDAFIAQNEASRKRK